MDSVAKSVETFKHFRKLSARKDGGLRKEKAKSIIILPTDKYREEYDRIFRGGKK